MTRIICEPNCNCGRHNIPKCIKGCTCYRHKGKVYNPDPKDWKNSEYFVMHKRVRTERGSATLYACVACGEQAEHWAQRHDEDGTQIEHYDPMCLPCHHVYDDTHKHAGFHGRSHSVESRRKMSAAHKGKSWMRDATPEQQAAFKRSVSSENKRLNQEIREWAMLRYPDLRSTDRLPDDVREAWEYYQWWQVFRGMDNDVQ